MTKTNSVLELLKLKGVGQDLNIPVEEKTSEKSIKSRRRRIYEEVQNLDNLEPTLGFAKSISSQNDAQQKTSGDKVSSNLVQSGGKVSSNLVQSSFKLSAQLSSNLVQDLSKSSPKMTFGQLVGLQKAITLFIYEQCKMIRSEVTNSITIQYLSEHCQTTVFAAQSAIQRLEKKSVLERVEFKNGRGGWTKYSLKKDIFSEIYQSESTFKLSSNLVQSSFKVSAQLSSTLSSSSSLKEGRDPKTTTTTKFELPGDWKEIDCAPLRDLTEPFGENHLRRLFKSGKTNPAQVQESIKRVAYAVKNKTQTFRKTPTAMLMGLLSEGIDFDAPKGYYSIMQSEQAISTKAEEEPESTQEEKAAAEEAKAIIKNLGKSLFGEMPKT
ncbi:MAG: hypothetical protein ABIQ95_04290 [Bdellovibrionia bacterium]